MVDQTLNQEKHEKNWLTLGQLTSPYGIKGWLKVYSFTDPKENIFTYANWLLTLNHEQKSATVSQWRQHSQGLIVKLEGIDDRTAAETLSQAWIKVSINDLPALPLGEFYWHQLEGLEVRNLQQVNLGRVDHLLQTGANDVLVVRESFDGKERLIPFLPDRVIQQVSLEDGFILVDWDANF